jgi:uncharacterized protein (TIGR00255 family)
VELEPQIRKLAQSKFRRGRVEVQLQLEGDVRCNVGLPILNKNLLSRYKEIYQEAAYLITGVHSSLTNIEANAILARSNVISVGWVEDVVTSYNESVLAIVESAICKAFDSRLTEGRLIEHCLREKLAAFHSKMVVVKELSNDLVGQHFVKLQGRIGNLLRDVTLDESRLMQEVAFLCDKHDIAEEIQRLDAHLDLFQGSLDVCLEGKHLDFICQELLREVNTIGSKVQQSSLQQVVIELKGIIEEIREQAQNVE